MNSPGQLAIMEKPELPSKKLCKQKKNNSSKVFIYLMTTEYRKDSLPSNFEVNLYEAVGKFTGYLKTIDCDQIEVKHANPIGYFHPIKKQFVHIKLPSIIITPFEFKYIQGWINENGGINKINFWRRLFNRTTKHFNDTIIVLDRNSLRRIFHLGDEEFLSLYYILVDFEDRYSKNNWQGILKEYSQLDSQFTLDKGFELFNRIK